MGNFMLGLKAMFRVMGDDWFSFRVNELLTMSPPPDQPTAPKPRKIEPVAPRRSDALTLLSVLQREGRLVDFLKESIGDYTDQQIGAAVRSVHKDCAAALDRMLAIAPLREEAEGSPITVPSDYDSAKFRLTGNVSGGGPFRGQLCHQGWRASKVELPEWTGHEDAAQVVSPAEVEVK
jgi:hypothetical protein